MNILTKLQPVKRYREFISTAWHSDFVHKVFGTFATRVGILILSFITTVVIARVLGPEGRGLYALAVATSAIGIQFGNLGLHASNTYYVSRQPNLLPELLGNSSVAGLGIGTLGSIIAWVIFSILPQLAPVQEALLMLALLSIPFGLTYIFFQSLLLGINQVKAYNLIDLGSKFFSTLLISMLVVVGRITPEWLFSAVFAGNLLSVISSFVVLKKHAKKIHANFRVFKNSIFYGSKAYLSAFFSFLTFRIGLFIVQYRFGAEMSGYFSVALTLAEMTYLFPIVIGNLLFPRLSALPNERSKRQTAHKLASFVGCSMILICLVTGSMAEWLVNSLFGKDFAPAVPILYALLPGVVVLSANTIYMNYLAAIGMPIVTVYSPAIACGLLLIFSLSAFSNNMGSGIATATSFAWASMLMISLFWLWIKRENYE